MVELRERTLCDSGFNTRKYGQLSDGLRNFADSKLGREPEIDGSEPAGPEGRSSVWDDSLSIKDVVPKWECALHVFAAHGRSQDNNRQAFEHRLGADPGQDIETVLLGHVQI
jgi:hypothetical protein